MSKTGAIVILILIILIESSSCKKYLDVKPNKQLVVPSTVQDLQGILDYSNNMNYGVGSEATEIASDNYYLTDNEYRRLPQDFMRWAYIWDKRTLSNLNSYGTTSDWNLLYTVVYNANVVLDNIDNISRTELNRDAWDYCKGSAYLYRAKTFYEIAQIWAKAYDSISASIELGIPLRLTSDFNVPSLRSSIHETYYQIVIDLETAIKLLPLNKPGHPFRPYKATAYALLARTYLTVGDYKKALKYSDSCLSINNQLLDYNDLDLNADFPFQQFQYNNPEDLMHTTTLSNHYNLLRTRGKIDSSLFKSYDENDLRKHIFFWQNADLSHRFIGSYNGSTLYYNGIATDEVYLTRSECYARLNNKEEALKDLNVLLEKRWRSGTFAPVEAATAQEALLIILNERRKELVYRMLRFTDLKRLNRDGWNITLSRMVDGQSYTLLPNDNRFALPIPEEVLLLTGMEGN